MALDCNPSEDDHELSGPHHHVGLWDRMAKDIATPGADRTSEPAQARRGIARHDRLNARRRSRAVDRVRHDHPRTEDTSEGICTTHRSR